MAAVAKSGGGGGGEPKREASVYVKTGGAMLGGAIEACALQPLDVLKTRMQLGGAKAGLVSVATATVKEEGVRALYKGLSPFIMHLVTKYSVRWCVRRSVRVAFGDG